jgi:hypothetical protein
MEIVVANEQAFHYVPRFSPDVAQDRVEQKKTGLVVGAVGALFSRPKPEEIHLVSLENRLEPFWLVNISSYTSFNRNRTYTITTSGPEVRRVTVMDRELAVETRPKESPAFTINAVEHCVEEGRANRTFDGISGEKVDMSKYATLPKTVVVDLEGFKPEGVVVIPPQVRAAAVVRQVISEVIKPVQQAHIIHEERVTVEAIELNFRPVFAFEYEWSAKGKRSVIEFDALTGDIQGGGRKLSDQFKGIITRDLLFDVTADAVSMIVPGGSIAVKLVKAVVDRGKS